jgi:hypothetical protein
VENDGVQQSTLMSLALTSPHPPLKSIHGIRRPIHPAMHAVEGVTLANVPLFLTVKPKLKPKLELKIQVSHDHDLDRDLDRAASKNSNLRMEKIPIHQPALRKQKRQRQYHSQHQHEQEQVAQGMNPSCPMNHFQQTIHWTV